MSAEELLLSDRKLTSVDSLEAFKKLKKLELRGNCLKSLGFLEMNHGLCWLGLAKNKLRKISSLLLRRSGKTRFLIGSRSPEKMMRGCKHECAQRHKSSLRLNLSSLAVLDLSDNKVSRTCPSLPWLRVVTILGLGLRGSLALKACRA